MIHFMASYALPLMFCVTNCIWNDRPSSIRLNSQAEHVLHVVSALSAQFSVSFRHWKERMTEACLFWLVCARFGMYLSWGCTVCEWCRDDLSYRTLSTALLQQGVWTDDNLQVDQCHGPWWCWTNINMRWHRCYQSHQLHLPRIHYQQWPVAWCWIL